MDITLIVIIVIVLHFVVGFGYLIYKLSPRKEDAKKKKEDSNNN